LAVILFLPWGVFALVLLAIALLSMNGPPTPNPGWAFFVGLWFFLGLATDIAFGIWSRQKLLTQFRVVAQQRFARSAGFWRRLLGGGA
jgi:hypothetical protein